MTARNVGVSVICCMLLQLLCSISGRAQLVADFYDSSCPNLENIVASVIEAAVKADPRTAASLTRLHFHDCFVQGCDGSILLVGPTLEQVALPNLNSIRGMDVIENAKLAVENVCKGIVSCADILAIAAKVSVVLAGGPSWTVLLGRRDSTTANQNAANTDLPSPFDPVDTIVAKFNAKGLTALDAVALSGAHTFGRARCGLIFQRLYDFNGTRQSDPTIAPAYLQILEAACPQGGDGSVLVNMDPVTPDVFDNQYFLNLQNSQGLLESDEGLFSASGASTTPFVNAFASDQATFFDNFAASMIAMGNISPLTGWDGEIRVNCSVVNSY